MADSSLAEKIADMRSRLDGLREPSTVTSTQFGEVLEELQVSLEELSSAEAELEEEGESLAAANRTLQEGLRWLCQDITERKQMEAALRQAYDELDQKVQERTTELAQTVDTLTTEVARRIQAEAALRDRSEQLRRLASELTLAEQRERRRFTDLLHDGLQQLLVAARFQLRSLD